MLVETVNSIATLARMKKETKPLEDWQREDAERLSALFKKRAGKTQADFGAEFEIGGQAMVWQYLNAHRPLNIKAAQAFAKGLEVDIDDFSPTIAGQIRAASGVVTAAAASIQAPNTANATATLGPVPSLEEMRERVREAVANARARDALPAEARDLIFEVVASTESGVTPVIFSLLSRHLADLTDTLRASLPSVQPIDESLSGSKSAQSEKGQAAHRAKLPVSENQDKGHERSTGTRGNR